MAEIDSAPACDVVCFGEAMVLFAAEEAGDLAASARFRRRLCGADSNVAIGLARMGLGVHWVSRVGDDAFGRFVIDALAAEGIGAAGIGVDAQRPTGVMFKSRVHDGSDPETAYYRAGSAAAALAPDDLPRSRLAAARHLHVTGISAALGPGALALCQYAMEAMRAAGGSVSFDPNLRPALWPDAQVMMRTLNALAARADWLLIGQGEAEQLTGLHEAAAVARFYHAAGTAEVVIKRGADGAVLYAADAVLEAAGLRVPRVVDTVGAGDAFAVGFLSARLDGLGPRQALDRGNAFGALAVQHAGDYEGLPRRPAGAPLESWRVAAEPLAAPS